MSLSDREKNQHYSKLLLIGVAPLKKCLSLPEEVVRDASKNLNVVFDTKETTCRRLQQVEKKENNGDNDENLPPLVPIQTRSMTMAQKKQEDKNEDNEKKEQILLSILSPENKPFVTRRIDSLLTNVEGVSKAAVAEKNIFLRQKFHWPPPRPLDKDVDLMCGEFFEENANLFPEGNSQGRIEFLYRLALVFFNKKELDEALEEDSEQLERVAMVKIQTSQDEKNEKLIDNAASAASKLVQDVIVSSHGSQSLRGKKGKELRRAARLCLLLSHPITRQTLKLNGKVEHLDRENIENLRSIEKQVEDDFIKEQLYRNETWTKWLERHTSATLMQIYRFANRLTKSPYPSWKLQKKFLLRALRASTQIHNVAGKASRIVYGKPERPNFDFFNATDFSGAKK